MRHLLAFLLGFTLMMALTHTVPAATPDEIRDEARARALEKQPEAVSREEKKPREGVTVARKPHSWIMTVHTPGVPLVFLQLYTDGPTCETNRAMISRQLGRLGWGRAACIEQVQH